MDASIGAYARYLEKDHKNMRLVIVESPAKAKTIEKFLGADFQVESSYGHIADLPSKEIGVDVLNGFKPKYEVSPDKTVWTFTLRDGLEWHDGKPVTSEDCSEASQVMTGATHSGPNRAVISGDKVRSSVRRVRAPGATAFTVTP